MANSIAQNKERIKEIASTKQVEKVNSASTPPKKKSGSSRKISQYRYPRSYTNDKRDYLSVKICKYDRKDAEKPKNFSKYELTERGTNKGTGKFRYKVDKVALTLSNTFTDGF